MIGFAIINMPKLNEYCQSHQTWIDDNWSEYFYFHQGKDDPLASARTSHGSTRYNCPVSAKKHQDAFLGLLEHLNVIGDKLRLFYIDDVAAVVGYNNIRHILPAELVTKEELKNYDGLTGAQMRQIAAPNTNLPAISGQLTKETAKTQIDEINKAISDLSAKKDAIESMEAEELKDIKSQLDALMLKMKERQESLMAQLNEKKQEMEAKMTEFQKQLFMLETQIYGIRCYLGEVVSFYTVRDGKPAPEEEPIVIYQKIRYLDEELGRYASLYHFGDSHKTDETLLSVLKHREDIAELLAPGQKSISVAKLSRTGTVKGQHPVFANTLEDYELYHANQLAILIRNGEQLHITWLDADKINLDSEDAFLTPGNFSTDEEPASGRHFASSWITERQREEELRRANEKNRHEFLSRWFFFNILQGILDNGGLICIPEKVSLTRQQSPYIVFSKAEGWITTSGYGTFCEMLEKSQTIPLVRGDMVLTGMRIKRGDNNYYRGDDRWNNDRGIGDKNRTRDISLPAKHILPINKVLPEIVVKYTANVYKAKLICDPHGIPMYRHADGSKSSIRRDETDEIDHYETTYSAELTNEFDHEETWELTVNPAHWYSYEKSYRKLSKSTLKRFCGKTEEEAYYLRDGRAVLVRSFGFGPQKEITEPVYWMKITDAEVVREEDWEYYISVKQNGYARFYHETEYHVNFRIDLGEFIPLTFLCSTWIKDIIQSGRVGDYRLCGAKMSFADLLPYLHQILEHLKRREEMEKNHILAAGGRQWLEENGNWDVILCIWKIENRIHELTETRAKRFLAFRH